MASGWAGIAQLKKFKTIVHQKFEKSTSKLSALFKEADDVQASEIALAKSIYDAAVAKAESKCKYARGVACDLVDPVIDKSREAEALCDKRIEELGVQIRESAHECYTAPADQITPAMIKDLLAYYDIESSIEVMTARGVTGQSFARMRTEAHVQTLLGVKPAGDCRRVLLLTSRIAAGLPMQEPQTTFTNEDHPSTWSTDRVVTWANDNELASIADILVKHKINGHVLISLNLDAVLPIMQIPADIMFTFEEKVTELRPVTEA